VTLNQQKIILICILKKENAGAWVGFNRFSIRGTGGGGVVSTIMNLRFSYNVREFSTT
jgi:hypothetical protein